MPQKGFRKLDNIDPQVIRNKRHVERKTLNEIAVEIGCSTMSLSRFCKENKIENPKLEKKLFLDLTSRRFGYLEVIRPLDKRSHCSCIIWECKCMVDGCGKIIERASNVLVHGAETNQSCGCFVSIQNFTGRGDLSATYFNSLKNGAISRKLTFEIGIDYAWKLFQSQEGKCALSGVEIKLNARYRSNLRKGLAHQTASLDRIDSTRGYVEGNLQWAHRRLNVMKSNLPNQEFLDWCATITRHNTQGGFVWNSVSPIPETETDP